MAEERKLNIQEVSDKILKALQDGYSDYEIDQALIQGYPQLLNKGSYDKTGEYIPGAGYREFLLEVEGKKDQGEQLDILLMLPTTFWILPLLV